MTITSEQAELLGSKLMEQTEVNWPSRRRWTRIPFLYSCPELKRLPPTERRLAVTLAMEFVKKNWSSRYGLPTTLFAIAVYVPLYFLAYQPSSFDPAHGSLGLFRQHSVWPFIWPLGVLTAIFLPHCLYVRKQVRKFAAELAAMSGS
jgi:hypothetical protein